MELLALFGAAVAFAAPAVLPVPGFGRAALLRPSLPGPRPLVVGLHGNFDRPEWFCASLEPLLAGRAYAICPRGVPRHDAPSQLDRWTFPDRARIRAEVEAGRRALDAQAGVTVADGPLLLAGFSLGAIAASRLALQSPARFPRLYLVEGGQAIWTAEALRFFAKQGGHGLLLGCGGAGCAAASKQLCKRAKLVQLSCAVVTAKGLGHSYTDPLPELARSGFEQLLRGDHRW